ncbi:sigma-54 dependent transcriptional regulator [Myxococcota bacterium]|nr:sigma-54 dependent transcriptional regulator [Myxococcota bacterium]
MRLLLVEDDRIIRITVRDALADAGYDVVDCSDGAAAARRLDEERFDILLSDVRLPGLDGVSLFARARASAHPPAVVLMTAFADTETAVRVMREGVRDYVLKPFEMDELMLRIGRIRDELQVTARLDPGADAPSALGRLVGETSAMTVLRERVEAAAESEFAVLITGETGTGKDLIANLVHELGPRASKPFVAVNCAALPEALFEAEMFGHERGAFTGADRKRQGRFEAANGGTLFLDEVGELSPGNQAKLLRAIDTMSFEPVGSSQTVRVDVRIIAATNRDFSSEVAKGTFRRDLYYRLNVIDVRSPPLRERRSDIPLLVSKFLADISGRHHRPTPVLTPRAAAALATHDYPGNVRELLHALERAVALSRGRPIEVEHLPPEVAEKIDLAQPDAVSAELERQSLPRLEDAVAEFERQYVARAVELTGGHKGKAASMLGISRKSLWERLRDARGGGDPER